MVSSAGRESTLIVKKPSLFEIVPLYDPSRITAADGNVSPFDESTIRPLISTWLWAGWDIKKMRKSVIRENFNGLFF